MERYFLAAEERGTSLPPPKFKWTPAHRDIDVVINVECSMSSIEEWLGNAWADYFAKLGAMHHAVAKVTTESAKEALKEHRKVLRYISWGVQQVVASEKYGRDAVPGPRPPEMRAPVPVQRANDHVLVRNARTGELKCKICGVSARTQASLDNIRVGGSRRCEPSSMTQALTRDLFGPLQMCGVSLSVTAV